jgi:hypothetical protein
VGVKAGQAERPESLLEDPTDGGCIAPMIARQPTDHELLLGTVLNKGGRKQRII